MTNFTYCRPVRRDEVTFYEDKKDEQDEIEKIGTLGVNYEFVHDRLKNPEDFNTSDENVKGDDR